MRTVGSNDCQNDGVREWLVGGAVIETDEGLLLVRNRRRNGTHDWTPPGGVIEADDGEALLAGLEREVYEETGLQVTSWGAKLYEVEAQAPALGWVMKAQIWMADTVVGDVAVGNDPDGIVVDAAYVSCHECEHLLVDSHHWVREPLVEWIGDRWPEPRTYRYRLDGDSPAESRIVRLP